MTITSDNLFILSTPDPEFTLNHARILHRNLLRGIDFENISASTEADDAPVDSITRPDTFEYWEPTAMNATVDVELDDVGKFNAVGIAGHTMASQSAGVRVLYSTDNVTYTLWTEFIPGNDRPVLILNDLVTANFIRFEFFGDNAPRIAVVYIGQALTMQRPFYGGHTPLNLSAQTETTNNRSRGGQFLGQYIRREGYQTSVSVKNLEAQWIRDSFRPFIRDARQYPYFISWNPRKFPTEVGYVWTQEDIAPSNMGIRDLMDVGWSMQGIGDE